MKCPHCLTAFFEQETKEHAYFYDSFYEWLVTWEVCPACERGIGHIKGVPQTGEQRDIVGYLFYPRGVARAPLPAEVPGEFASDYREACLVLPGSAKASAALSRRCLQHLLREKARTTKRDLADQIDEVIPTLPSHLAAMIDTLRVLGNFAAHPMKSTNTGDIIEVEPGEAEWLLDTLEQLFDFYFVQPAQIQKKRAAISQKLAEAGKPPLK